MRTLIIKTDGTIVVGDNTVNLAFLQKTVDGYIEAISYPGWHAYCNEEGKLLSLPLNVKATQLARALGWDEDDVLVGDVIFLGDTHDGDEADVTDHVLQTLDNLS